MPQPTTRRRDTKDTAEVLTPPRSNHAPQAHGQALAGGRTRRRLAALGAGTFALAVGRRAAAQAEVVANELPIVTFFTFFGMDPVHEFSAIHLRSVGAAEALLRVAPQGDVETELARSFTMIDPNTWHVSLRPEVRFWSGRPVDARAVVESLERSRALAPPAATLLRGVQVEPVDEWTVQFRSDAVLPGLPLVLADNWLTIHNPETYGPQANSYNLGAVDLTGFYRITGYEPRVWATLARNVGYWGVAPRHARLRLDEITDADARSLAALSGEAHIVRQVTPSAARQIERSRTMRIAPLPGTNVFSAYLNTQRPPFDDDRVRRALAHAADREEVVALAFDGRGTAAPTLLAALPAYPEARRAGYVRPDLAAARQLLDDAGWRLSAGGPIRTKDGTPLRFRLLWWGAHRAAAEVLQTQWAHVGADVAIEGSPDFGFLAAKRAQGDWDSFIQGAETFGEPMTVLSRVAGAQADNNFAQFRDAETDSLLAAFAGLLDPEERRQQALRINARHAALVPFIPLYTQIALVAVGRQVRNYREHFLFYHEVHPDLWASA